MAYRGGATENDERGALVDALRRGSRGRGEAETFRVLLVQTSVRAGERDGEGGRLVKGDVVGDLVIMFSMPATKSSVKEQ